LGRAAFDEFSLTVAIPLIGDLNSDGFVGQDDLSIVLGHFGQRVTRGSWIMGDATGDGFVGEADLNRVLSKWGQGMSLTAGSFHLVAEPQSLTLLAIASIASMGLMGCRMRRSSV
jgi:hypothetical protein